MLPAGFPVVLLALYAATTPSPRLGGMPVLCSPADRPVVAEVFYDATGDDTGREFVELLNPAEAPRSLAGLRLEAGDGAGPGRWTLRWTGGATDSIAAAGRFVIGGALVTPPPNAAATLDLQNGPDAVRLVWPDGVVEVVGYGALAHAEYACGKPAVDAPSGLSLARVPDGSNLGGNALDFRAWPPSPGRVNLADRDARLIPGSLALTPEQPEPGRGARLTGAVVNRGAQSLAAGAITIVGSLAAANPAPPPAGGNARTEADVIPRPAPAASAGGERPGTADPPLFTQPIPVAIASGDSAAFAVETGPLAAGRHVLHVRVALASDASDANDHDSLRVRVGEGPLEITEIQFHPGAGEGEWVEVRNRDLAILEPADFTLSDRGTTRGLPAEGSGSLAPESLAVLAQDRAALLARFPALDPARVWEVSPWPALNNSNDSTGVADAVVLREVDGTPCARVHYSATGVPEGVPIELRAGEWRPSSAGIGTPLAPPLALGPLATRFQLAPRRVRAGARAVRLAWSLPWARARISVEVYDLAGRRVARPLTEAPAAGRGEREWGLDGLAPGLYLVALVARAEAGGDPLRETTALRVEGAAP